MILLFRNLYSFSTVKNYYAAEFPFSPGRPENVINNICPFLIQHALVIESLTHT